MKTILVPVDFSPTAFNAAVYAIEFAKQINGGNIILYNAYELPIATDNGLTVPFLININDLKTNSEIALLHLKDQLQQLCNNNVTLLIMNSYNTVIMGITEVAKNEKADLVIMGITGANATEEAFIGSNTLHLAKHIELPVIIVPPFVKFSAIKNILLVSDYHDVYETTPVDIITEILDITKAAFHVLYVHQTKKELVGAEVPESITLNTLFQGYDPQYHYTQNDNFIDGVNDFVESNAIDLLLIIPKHHSVVDKIFHRSKTKMMVFHSYIPVLVVHDNID
jgi:nucleotide-binding universal stress UspA family protein